MCPENCNCSSQDCEGYQDGKVKPGLSTAEQVEEIMDHNIEIESNKRMRSANVNPWTLRFKDAESESKVNIIGFVTKNSCMNMYSVCDLRSATKDVHKYKI